MREFVDGLIYALNQRPSRKLRQIMLEVTLLRDINDSTDDAHHLAQNICKPLQDKAPLNQVFALFNVAVRVGGNGER